MSLLDNLVQFSNFRQGSQRASSLSLRTRLDDQQQSEQSACPAADRVVSKSLSKLAKPKCKDPMNPANINHTGKLLYKFVHVLNRKLKTIRYFFFVKLETLKKMNIRIADDKKEEEGKDERETEEKAEKAEKVAEQEAVGVKPQGDGSEKKLRQQLESFVDCFHTLYLKEFATRTQLKSFNAIKRYSEYRQRLLTFSSSLCSTLSFTANNIQKHTLTTLKQWDRLYQKTSLFISMCRQFLRRQSHQDLRFAFVTIQLHSFDVANARKVAEEERELEEQRRRLAELEAEHDRLERDRVQQHEIERLEHQQRADERVRQEVQMREQQTHQYNIEQDRKQYQREQYERERYQREQYEREQYEREQYEREQYQREQYQRHLEEERIKQQQIREQQRFRYDRRKSEGYRFKQKDQRMNEEWGKFRNAEQNWQMLARRRQQQQHQIRQRLQQQIRVRQQLEQQLKSRLKLQQQLRLRQRHQFQARRHQQQRTKQKLPEEHPNTRYSVKSESKQRDYDFNNRRTSKEFKPPLMRFDEDQRVMQDFGSSEQFSSRGSLELAKTVPKIQFSEKKPKQETSTKKRIILSRRTSIDNQVQSKKLDPSARPLQVCNLPSCELTTKLSQQCIAATFKPHQSLPKALYRQHPDPICQQIHDQTDNIKLFLECEECKPGNSLDLNSISNLQFSDVKSFTDSIKGGGGLLSQMEKIREQEAMTRTTKLDNPAKFTTPAQFFRTSEMGFESAASYKQMYQQPVKDIQNSSPYIKQKIARQEYTDSKPDSLYVSRRIKESCMEGSGRKDEADWQTDRNRRMGSETRTIRLPQPPKHLLDKTSSSQTKIKPIMMKAVSNPNSYQPPYDPALYRRPTSETTTIFPQRVAFFAQPQAAATSSQYSFQSQQASSSIQSEYYLNRSKMLAEKTAALQGRDYPV